MEFIGSVVNVLVVLALYAYARDWLAGLRAEVAEMRAEVAALRKQATEAGAYAAEIDRATVELLVSIGASLKRVEQRQLTGGE